MGHACHSRLEFSGDAVHIGTALLLHALRHFLLGEFQLLDANELFLERLRRAGVVTDLVGPPAIRHVDLLVTLRQCAQNLADAADRCGDGNGAEHGKAGKHGDDEETDAEIDAADLAAFRARLRIAVFGSAHQVLSRLLDQDVHLPAEIERTLNLAVGVAVVLRRGGKLGADRDIVVGERIDLSQLLLVRSLVGQIGGSRDMLRRGGSVGTQPLQRAIDIGADNGKTHLAHFDLHGCEIFGRTQRLDGGFLLVRGDRALMRGPAIANLLFGKHASDQQHAEHRPDRELRANGKIEARHRQSIGNGAMIKERG